MSSPMTAPVSTQSRTATHQGTPKVLSTTPRTAAEVPAANPALRSISPSRSTNTSPMAMKMTAADWLSRLAKLSGVLKMPGLRAENSRTRTMTPRTELREPMSPERTFAQ